MRGQERPVERVASQSTKELAPLRQFSSRFWVHLLHTRIERISGSSGNCVGRLPAVRACRPTRHGGHAFRFVPPHSGAGRVHTPRARGWTDPAGPGKRVSADFAGGACTGVPALRVVPLPAVASCSPPRLCLEGKPQLTEAPRFRATAAEGIPEGCAMRRLGASGLRTPGTARKGRSGRRGSASPFPGPKSLPGYRYPHDSRKSRIPINTRGSSHSITLHHTQSHWPFFDSGSGYLGSNPSPPAIAFRQDAHPPASLLRSGRALFIKGPDTLSLLPPHRCPLEGGPTNEEWRFSASHGTVILI